MHELRRIEVVVIGANFGVRLAELERRMDLCYETIAATQSLASIVADNLDTHEEATAESLRELKERLLALARETERVFGTVAYEVGRFEC